MFYKIKVLIVATLLYVFNTDTSAEGAVQQAKCIVREVDKQSQEISLAQKKWIQVLHIAKKQCGLDDEAYRALLTGAAGVESSGGIRTWKQYNDCLAAFKKLGFKAQSRTSGKSKLKETEPQQGRPERMISARQEYYIRGLWDLASRVKDEASLRRMIKRIGAVDNIQWLTRENARKVILALRDIAWKAGYNPDHPPDRETDKEQG